MTTAPVKFEDLLAAFDFVNSGGSDRQEAYISLDTGKIYWLSDWIDPEDPPPDGMAESDRYHPVPTRNELNLGAALAVSFAEEVCPEDYVRVKDFFRRSGAYARFKDFLEMRGLLERWYAHESRWTEEALRAWCAENKIELMNQLPASGRWSPEAEGRET